MNYIIENFNHGKFLLLPNNMKITINSDINDTSCTYEISSSTLFYTRKVYDYCLNGKAEAWASFCPSFSEGGNSEHPPPPFFSFYNISIEGHKNPCLRTE